jgi:hypothetical protein
MKKYLLVFLVLLLTAAVVTATVLNSNRKTTKNTKSKCTVTKTEDPSAKKLHCEWFKVACY